MELFDPSDREDVPAPGKVLKLPRVKGELTKLQAKFFEEAVKLYGESALERGDLGYLHSLFANCYLPRSPSKDRRYIHQNGAYSILIEAGALCEPGTNRWVDQPLPSGSKPRALMAYVSTYAVKNNTREVPLGRSLSDFVRKMSGEVSGGATGTLGQCELHPVLTGQAA